MEKQLLTIAEIAKRLDIPESTARFYRDRFEDFIPSVGEGRKKRYKPETVEILQFIADGFKHNLTTADIENGLASMVARNIEVEKEAAATQAVVQQESKTDALQLQAVLKNMSATLEIIAGQKEEITELRKHIANVEKTQQEQQKYIDTTLIEREKRLMESIRAIQQQHAAAREKKWWQFWR